jgi:hypothetical protein
MKYIITESRIKNIIIQYLNDIDWRVLTSSNDEFPLEVFEDKSDSGATFIVRVISHKYGDSNLLLIRSSFQEKLERMFGKNSVGDENDEPNTLIMDWFSNHFNIDIEDYSYMDEYFMNYN